MRSPYRDRRQAGRKIAARLLQLELPDPVVLALARGGLPVGSEIATALDAPLDIVLVRKIGSPGNPELALGALAEGEPPELVVNDDVRSLLGIEDATVEAGVRQATLENQRRRALYRPDLPPVDVAGRSAIVVDDGIATGATIRAALRSVRRRGPARLVLAVGVATPSILAELASEVDDIVCPLRTEHLHAVGMHFLDFSAVEDHEVIELLSQPGLPD